MIFFRNTIIAVGATMALVATADAAQYRVTVTNNAPASGTYLTPVWVGFHSGSFDLFESGSAASGALERVAEDGNTGPLSANFSGSGVDATLGAGPIGPSMNGTAVFNLVNDGSNDYLSFASMILPSSDFFIGNGDPLAVSVADLLDGMVNSVTYTVLNVWDAGTEVNDFATSAGNPLVGFPPGQSGPDQGADENGVVTLASGAEYEWFLNVGDNDVAPLNFDNFASIATIEVALVPVPAAVWLFGSALGLLGWMRSRAV